MDESEIISDNEIGFHLARMITVLRLSLVLQKVPNRLEKVFGVKGKKELSSVEVVAEIMADTTLGRTLMTIIGAVVMTNKTSQEEFFSLDSIFAKSDAKSV